MAMNLLKSFWFILFCVVFSQTFYISSFLQIHMATETAKKVQNGDSIKIHYKGTFPDGVVFDSSEGREPIAFTVGEGKVIKGFDAAVLGMKQGEKKSVTIQPADAYGDKNPKLVLPVPKDRLPKDMDPQPGLLLTLQSPDGRVIRAKIDRIENDKIMLDVNHPLAGKTLHFDLELIEVKKAYKQ